MNNIAVPPTVRVDIGCADVDGAAGGGDLLNEFGAIVGGGHKVLLETEMAVLVAFDCDKPYSLGFCPAVYDLENVIVADQLRDPSLGFDDQLTIEAFGLWFEAGGSGLLLVSYPGKLLGRWVCGGVGGVGV